MYLGIRTDSHEAKLYLHDGRQQVAMRQWQADRELARDLLKQLEVFLADQQCTFDDLKGLFVFQGPGSFTGLRIGMTVLNTMAYSLSVPVVATQGDTWLEEAVRRLELGEDDKVALPFYGADARITTPKK